MTREYNKAALLFNTISERDRLLRVINSWLAELDGSNRPVVQSQIREVLDGTE